MSLTIRRAPQELMPTYNQVIIVATSSEQSRLNYQLVTDVYCRGEMVTRMKMFGFLSQNHHSPAAPAPAPAPAPAYPVSNQFNMASIMKMQSTGCKSCRG